MANLRNEFEFRSALLTALGQEHTEAEAKNEEMWRRKMLDGLGVEYDQNDVNQFGLFREKLIEGVTSKSEGGGSSWQTVFEGSVTTTAEDNVFSGKIEGLGSLTANTIKVTFNGVEYTCERDQDGYYGAPFNFETEQYDWSKFPFVINTSEPGETWLVTETAGTYTLKIEEEQSGGSSDFSTAEVTIQITTENPDVYVAIPAIVTTPMDMILNQQYNTLNSSTAQMLTVPLYKGSLAVTGNSAGEISVNVSGSVEKVGTVDFIITGDCTITIS